jgi:hypothetical protein
MWRRHPKINQHALLVDRLERTKAVEGFNGRFANRPYADARGAQESGH